jgi:hypothetical protein
MPHVAQVMVNNPLYVPRVTIAMLPDVALLEIFDFYVHGIWDGHMAWYKLVHVCQKWRNVVFGSPVRLDLRLYCTDSTPVVKMLDVWPPLPIVINVSFRSRNPLPDTDNIISALKHNLNSLNDRICQLELILVSSERVLETIQHLQKPFPALTLLDLTPLLLPGHEMAPIDADSFLGGSAPPHLQTLKLSEIPFLGLPKLVMSATHLVHLNLSRIPHSGYISPETMVTCVSALTRLETLHIGFKSPQSRPDRRRPPLPTRTLLPVLTELWFQGVTEYLEDFVARINAPLLDKLNITFFHQLLFDTPQLVLFISHAPKFKTHDKLEARVVLPFNERPFANASVTTYDGRLRLEISCREFDQQLSSLAQVCRSSFPQALISTVEQLYIEEGPLLLHYSGIYDRRDNIQSTQWLEFFHPFTAVKHLYITWKSSLRIATALQELDAETVTEVLPTLQTLFLEAYPSKAVQEAVEKFVAARQLSGQPIAVSRWSRWSRMRF